ncbi:hypothetical protein [Mycobacteroides abscessus]|uniref:hypothetical protein n=1 Tax=Mycobacteroides abscessus TaxID=36809 RepID=UPI0009A68EB4|nr:hypothetical protein [Mycobacteroides abscessus]
MYFLGHLRATSLSSTSGYRSSVSNHTYGIHAFNHPYRHERLDTHTGAHHAQLACQPGTDPEPI